MYSLFQRIIIKEVERMSCCVTVFGVRVIYGSNMASFYTKIAAQLALERNKSQEIESLICLSSLGFQFNFNLF
jgi:hypothetical protein